MRCYEPSSWLFPIANYSTRAEGLCSCPVSNVHYSIKQDPGSRPLRQVVLLPVDVYIHEMSAGGVNEEVPEWIGTVEKRRNIV
jgi:hypothetical protein